MGKPFRPWFGIGVVCYLSLLAATWALCRGPITGSLAREPQGELGRFCVETVLGLSPTFPADLRPTRWREFVDACLIAALFHLAIVILLRRLDHRGQVPNPARRPSWHTRLWTSLILGTVGAIYLGLAARPRIIQDYFLYGQIWNEVRQWHDPWFLVTGLYGYYSLNAYGPLYNLFAPLTWINPLLPRLLFAFSYVLFAVFIIKVRAERLKLGTLPMLGLLAWVWNPFCWVEIPLYGHFDILVGLLSIAAVEARVRDRDVPCGVWLGLGILLKYMPLFLVPFLALDRGRIRRWPILTAALVTVCGLALSELVWGVSTLRPLTLAVRRDPAWLSIHRYLWGNYSPLAGWNDRRRVIPELANWIMLLALARAWSWSRARHPEPRSAALLGILTTLLFYPVGFPQYQMVPFVLATDWFLCELPNLKYRPLVILALVGYFGWLGGFDAYEARNNLDSILPEDWIGLPTFVLGCFLVVSLVLGCRRQGNDDDAEGGGSRSGIASPRELRLEN